MSNAVHDCDSFIKMAMKQVEERKTRERVIPHVNFFTVDFGGLHTKRETDLAKEKLKEMGYSCTVFICRRGYADILIGW